MALFREFAQLDAGATRLPDESTILRFRHLLEANNLASQILATVNAKLMERGSLLKAGTAANEHDITQAHELLHGEEAVVFADSGYRGITKREEIQAQHPRVDWQVAMMPDKRRALKKSKTVGALIDKLEKIKASIRAKVEHPFRVIKCQFGYRKTRYRGLIKNTAQIIKLFALSNLWM